MALGDRVDRPAAAQQEQAFTYGLMPRLSGGREDSRSKREATLPTGRWSMTQGGLPPPRGRPETAGSPRRLCGVRPALPHRRTSLTRAPTIAGPQTSARGPDTGQVYAAAAKGPDSGPAIRPGGRGYPGATTATQPRVVGGETAPSVTPCRPRPRIPAPRTPPTGRLALRGRPALDPRTRPGVPEPRTLPRIPAPPPGIAPTRPAPQGHPAPDPHVPAQRHPALIPCPRSPRAGLPQSDPRLEPRPGSPCSEGP